LGLGQALSLKVSWQAGYWLALAAFAIAALLQALPYLMKSRATPIVSTPEAAGYAPLAPSPIASGMASPAAPAFEPPVPARPPARVVIPPEPPEDAVPE